jgi:predicted metal-dependent HD superfamily phosphohydrolase
MTSECLSRNPKGGPASQGLGVPSGAVFECRHRPFALPDALVGELAAAYGEAHRAYHNATHIKALLGWFDRIADDPGWQAPADVYAAIVFHDAIYDPAAKDNEARSAAWARRAITEHALPASAARVVELIELTAKHGGLETASGDAALFLDADMSILGAPIDVYREYARNVRHEYKSVPAAAYRTGRGAFLESVARKPRIYFTDYFHTRLDAQARTNLADELATLSSGALD